MFAVIVFVKNFHNFFIKVCIICHIVRFLFCIPCIRNALRIIHTAILTNSVYKSMFSGTLCNRYTIFCIRPSSAAAKIRCRIIILYTRQHIVLILVFFGYNYTVILPIRNIVFRTKNTQIDLWHVTINFSYVERLSAELRFTVDYNRC